jgi:HlyD family secretion protein
VARAKIAWQAAETDRKRFEALWKDGVIGRRDYDAALVAEATAKQTYLEKSRGSRSEDRAADTASLQAAQDRLSYLERQKDELVVRAPTDGIVQSFDLRPGDLVNANQAVASILERDQLWVRVYVPEPRLSAVHVGDAVDVAIDGTTKRFPGRIVEIRDRAEYTPRNLQTQEQRMEQVFGVKVVVEPSPELKPGMAAFVHLRPAVKHG